MRVISVNSVGMRKVISRISKRSGYLGLPLVFGAAAFRYLGRVFRVLALRALNTLTIGKNCYIGRGLRFVYPQRIFIKNDVVIRNGVRFWSEKAEGYLKIGDRAEIGADVLLDFSGGLEISEDVLISEGVLIYTHNHGYNPRSEPTAKLLQIGHKAWIGARAIVLPSVRRIGEGAIVGAGSIVSEDVPDGMIYIGAKGRLIDRKEEVPTPLA